MKKHYIIGASILSILEIGIALWFTFWREGWWNSVSNKDISGFLNGIISFTIVALLFCFVATLASYWISLAAIEWRKKLNPKAFAIRESRTENINQRIQEDCKEYPSLLLTLIFGSGKALVYLLVFATTLILEFSWTYLLILISYAIIATLIARIIAKPLITINYKVQQSEATYRNNLTALSFESCIFNMLRLAKKQKHLNYFQTFYAQLGVVIPILIIAPAYFTTPMTLGALMQATGIMATILENLSFGVNSFDSLNRFLASRKRLVEIKVIK